MRFRKKSIDISEQHSAVEEYIYFMITTLQRVIKNTRVFLLAALSTMFSTIDLEA